MSDMDLDAERKKITKQIKNLERILDPNIATIEVVVSDSNLDSDSEADSLGDDDWDEHLLMEEESWGESDEDDDSKDQALPKDPETCLQLNMVYQEVLQEKIAEIDLLLAQNKEQQEEVMWDLAGSKTPKTKDGKSLPSNVFVGHFMKPYFKDKVTGIGPPANEDTREKATQGIKSFEELIVTKWKTWEKTLLRKSVMSDHLQRLLQPKLLKLEYLNQKLDKVSNSMEKQILEKQIKNTEKEIEDINQLPEESLLGDRLDERDWEKISNINFEGSRSADEIRKFWQNCEHPSINKQAWVEEETKRLKEIAAKYNYLEWQKIAAELGTNRSAFQCLQIYQQYNKDLKRKEWTKEEDHMLTQLVEEMRVGSHIPYRKIVYYMEGRDSMQLIYRWTKSLNPSLKKGFWTPEEDAKLLQAVAKYGERDWFKIREEVPGRSDAQCRDRYLRRLHFSLKKGRWNEKEEEKLVELIEKYGAGHWAKIASELPHRTGSQCLSKWKALIRKKKPRKRQKYRKKYRSSSSSSSSSSSEDAEQEWHNDLEKERHAKKAPEACQYVVPSIDMWIPTRQSHAALWKDPGEGYSRPSTLSPCLSKASVTSRVAPKEGSKAIPKVAVALRRDPDWDKDTLDHSTVPVDTECTRSADEGLEKLQEEESEEASTPGKRVLKVTPNDVKTVIRMNTCLEYQKLKERLKKTHLFTSSLVSKINSGMAIEKVVQVCSKTFLNRQRQQKINIQRKRLDRKLLMAVTPWVGDITIRCWRSQKAVTVQTRAEAIMTKLQTIHMTSTPVFTLFIQLFQIDTDGCMKVIGERKTKQSELLLAIRGKSQQSQQASSSLQKSSGCLPMKGKETQRKSAASKMKDLPENARPGPVVLPSLGPKPKPKTVSELLREKRLRESRANKALENTVILAPQVLVTPPVILQQPLQPLLPSSLSPAQPLGSRSAGKPVAMASSPTATFQTSSPIITSTKSPEKNSITSNSGSSLGNEVIVEENINKTEGTSAPQVGVLVSGQSSSLMRAEGHCVPRESPVPRTTTNQALGVNQISTSSGPASLLSSQVTTTSGNQELPKASPFLVPAQTSMQQPKPISLVPTLSVPTCGPQVISSNILPITWVVTAQGLVPVSMSTLVGLPGPGKPAGTPVLPILGGVAKSQATLKLLPSSTVKQSPGAPEPSPSLAKRPLISSKTVQGDVASGTAGPSLPTHLPTTASSHTVSHSEKSNLPGDKPSFGGEKTAGEMSTPSPQPETQSQTKSPTNQPRAEPDDCYCASTPEAESPAGVNIGGQDSTQKGLLLETKDNLPFQNGDPEKSFPILTGTSKPITQSQEGMAAQDNQPKALEPGKSVLDLSLLSLENEASVREWLKGGKGVCLPQLQSTLPYLPPFLCNLKTLSGLLLQKKSLEQTAATMVAQGRVQDKNDVSRQDVQAARHLVQQQLKENPAYLLLKARFLAAFALPAFLATLSPPRVSTTLSRTMDRNNVSEEEKEEECSQSETRAKDRDCGGNEQLTNTTGDTQSTPGTMSSMQGSPHPVPNAMSGILDAADFNVLKTRNAVHARKRRRV